MDINEIQLQRYKSTSLRHCDKLLNDVRCDRDDIDSFFGGELYKAYVNATDEVLTKISKVRTKVRNL